METLIFKILIYVTVVVFTIHLIAGGITYMDEDKTRISRWMWRIIDYTSPALIILSLVDIVFLLRTCC